MTAANATPQVAGCAPVPYVSTGEAARQLGVDVRSLQRWVKAGLIEPDYTTPGGHHRWDVERLREELRNPSRRRDEP